MKTLEELEQVGIAGKYKDDGNLYIITIDKMLWRYYPEEQIFRVQLGI